MKSRVTFVILMAAICLSFSWASDTLNAPKVNDESLKASQQTFTERGKYVYDEVGFLPLESRLALSSYLWQLDVQSGYEIVVVFPKSNLDEESIIKWFNAYGVGKKKKDNGAALFVFPSGTFFLAIGSGNDKVSVTYAKTYGEKILQDFDKDPALTILRFVHSLNKEIATPTIQERTVKFGKEVIANLDLVFLWLLVVVLIAFLVQQFDGFQWHDLIAPAALVVLALIFTGVCAISKNEVLDTYHEYGIITKTEHSEYHWVQMMVVSTGKSTTVIPIPHTDYRNDVTILSYDLQKYQCRFTTTDNDGSYDHQVGEFEAMVIGVTTGALWSVYEVDDISGGKTIGDGVWLRKSP